jgi:hypothetical protein
MARAAEGSAAGKGRLLITGGSGDQVAQMNRIRAVSPDVKWLLSEQLGPWRTVAPRPDGVSRGVTSRDDLDAFPDEVGTVLRWPGSAGANTENTALTGTAEYAPGSPRPARRPSECASIPDNLAVVPCYPVHPPAGWLSPHGGSFNRSSEIRRCGGRLPDGHCTHEEVMMTPNGGATHPRPGTNSSAPQQAPSVPHLPVATGAESAQTVAVGGIDTSRPNIARVYDYWLGGKDNFAADRYEGDRLLVINPDLRRLARANRRFLATAVHWLAAECGIRQFLDLGSGLPAATGNTHEIAQKASPDCRVAYLDIDPVAVAHAGALLATSTAVQAAQGDLADPDAVLSDSMVRRVIDLGQPVAVVLAMVLHFFPQDTAARIVAGYTAAVPPGSYVVISCGSGDEALAREYRSGALYNHTREQIRQFFTGLELIDPPGLVGARAWQPDTPVAPPSADGGHVLAGVARKPGGAA